MLLQELIIAMLRQIFSVINIVHMVCDEQAPF